MKFLLFFFFSLSLLFSNEERFWILEKGHLFKGSFVEQVKKTTVIKLENGKEQRVPTESLGVADRFYLHTSHNIPIETLEGGNIKGAESKIRINKKEFETIKDLEIAVGEASVELQAIISPNFFILSDPGAKTVDYPEEFEKIIFSHAYRFPDYFSLKPARRESFLYIKDDDLYDQLGVTLLETLRAEGKHSELQLNQLEVDWTQFRGHRRYQIPQALAEKYNASHSVNIEFTRNSQSERERQAFGFMMHKWAHIPHTRGVKQQVFRDRDVAFYENREQSANFSYIRALLFTNSLHFSGTIGYGISTTDRDRTAKFLPLGGYGEPSKWGKEFEKQVKSGDLSVSFENFYRMPSGAPEITQAQDYRNYGLQIAALACFMDQDLKHQFGVCRLVTHFKEKKTSPTIDEIPAVLGYSSLEELEEAFTEFCKKVSRVKY